jgi:hypothetical protein
VRLPGAAAAHVPQVRSLRCGYTANDVLAVATRALVLGHDEEAMRVLRAERLRNRWDMRFAVLYDPRLDHLRKRGDFAATLL